MIATCYSVMLVNLCETKQCLIFCLVTSMRISNIYHIGIITTRERTVSIYGNSGNIFAILRKGVICAVPKGRNMLMVCFFKSGFRDTPVYFDEPGGS